MMHTSDETIIDHLVRHLKQNIKCSISGVAGPNVQAERVIKNLGLPNACFSINRYEGLYEMDLRTLNTVSMPDHFDVVSAK